MLTKAGKFKFNAETALHSPLLCVGAGGGEESLQTQPTMVSTPRTAPRDSPGARSTPGPCFWQLSLSEGGGGAAFGASL